MFAIYLRKSRGDLDKDLIKHKMVLTEKCKTNSWKYVLYEEVESGDSISMRPVMQKLLNDVIKEVFDAVLVMDIDRLGRGDMGDQDQIKKAFAKSRTYVVTEKDIYNLNNDDDEFIVDMKGFIARREYKEIVKRLVRGKKIGARLGMWTNGKPPYPYEYERWREQYNEKGLVVNEDKNRIFRYMIEMTLKNKLTPNEIAHELNKMKIPGPKSENWSGQTVYRILKNETHLGKIISNKTEGDGHTKKKPNSKEYKVLPKSEWVIVENCHQPVKTQEEHEQILIFFSRYTKMPRRSAAKKLPFTGLIKCAKCGHTMLLQERADREKQIILKPCWYQDSTGIKCINSGGSIDILNSVINNELAKYEKKVMDELADIKRNDLKEIHIQMDENSRQLEIKEKAILRIQEAYEAGVYSLRDYKKRTECVLKEIESLREMLEVLKLQIKHSKSKTSKERLDIITKFKEEMKNNNLSYEDMNTVFIKR